ncbi:MAG: putative sigma-54 modulation protein [Cryomorphaceae bacterium]|jgi:putative sigma-54 modulation protein
MQIAISGQHLEVTASLKQHVEEKLEKVIHHFDHLTQAQIVLHIEKEDHMAEANIHAKGTSIHATGLAENMYAAIDLMAQKLDRQVLKHKEKITNHR